MGIMVNAVSIFLGGLFGSLMKNHINVKYNIISGISIILISVAGFIENMFVVSENTLSSDRLLPVVFSLIIGTTFGEILKINKHLTVSDNNPFLTGSMLFGIGGLQISGPVLLAINNDSSQLILKSFVDFPLAVTLGATLGIKTIFSCFSVAVIQLLIAVIAYTANSFITESMVGQICSLGYILLFFTGFNLIVKEKYKIDTLNMLPSMVLLILYNVIINFFGGII